jgi:hypothetical protein
MLSVSSEHVMFDDNMPLLLGLVWCFVALESLSLDIPCWVCSQIFLLKIFNSIFNCRYNSTWQTILDQFTNPLPLN